jgi:hypothetical protein
MSKVVAVIIDKSLLQGKQQVTWNAEELQVGVYFYRLTANNKQQIANGKLAVVK